MDELRLAVKRRRRSIISRAIGQVGIIVGEVQALTDIEVVAARTLLEQLEQEDEVIRGLKAAMLARDKDLISKYLQQAEDLGIAPTAGPDSGDGTHKQVVVAYEHQREAITEGRELLTRLTREKNARQAFSIAVANKDKAKLAELISELEALQLGIELEKVRTTLKDIELQETVGRKLEVAMSSRDIEALDAALVEAEQRGLTGELLTRATTTKNQLEAEKQLQAAIQARDLRALDLAISRVKELELLTVDLPVALELKVRLDREASVQRQLKDVFLKHLYNPGSVDDIRRLLEEARSLGLNSDEVKFAQVAVIRQAQKDRNVSDLTREIENAVTLGVNMASDELVQAKASLQRLKEEQELKDRIKAAIESGQIQYVEEYMQQAQRMGIDDKDTQTAQRILSVFQKRTAGHAIKHWRYQLHKIKLGEAMKLRDSAKLASAIFAAGRFVANKPILNEAKDVLKDLQRQEEAVSDLRSALESHDIPTITVAIAKCVSLQIQTPIVKEAEIERDRLLKCEEAHKHVAKAVEAREEKLLKEAIELAQSQGVTADILSHAQSVLTHLQNERQIVQEVHEACKSQNLQALTRILKQTDPNVFAGFAFESRETIESARTVHSRLQAEHDCRQNLRKLANSRDREALAKVVSLAHKLMVSGDELDTATEQLARLQDMNSLREDLKDAMGEMNFERIKLILVQADNLGMKSDDIELARSVTRRNDAVHALRLAVDFRKQDGLKKAIATCDEINYRDKEVAAAKSLLLTVEKEDLAIADIEFAVQARDVPGLDQGLKNAAALGIVDRDEVRTAASKLEVFVNEDKCDEEAKVATVTMSIHKLDAVLKKASELKWTSPTIEEATKALELAHARENSRSALKRAQENRVREEIELALQTAQTVFAPNSPDIVEAHALIQHLLEEEALAQHIASALNSRDVTELRNCKQRSQELHVETELTKKCDTVLERVEIELKACNAIHEAARTRNLEALKKALNDATQLELQVYQSHMREPINQALELQEKLWKEQECTNALQAAIKQRNSAALSKAIETSNELGMPLPPNTKEFLAQFTFEESLRSRLRSATQKCEEPEIIAAMKEAEVNGISNCSEYLHAQQTINNMHNKQALKQSLSNSIRARDLTKLQVDITAAEKIGLEASELEAAKELQEKLLEENKLTQQLTESLGNGNLEQIVFIIEACEKYGIDGNILKPARARVSYLQEENRVCEMCKQAAESMNLERLESAIALANQMNSALPEVQIAKQTRQLLLDQNRTLELLIEVMAKNEQTALADIVKRATELKLENHPQVKSAIAALDQLNFEHRFFSAVDRENKKDVTDIMREASARGMGEQLQGWISLVRVKFERLVPQSFSNNAGNIASYFKLRRATVFDPVAVTKKTVDKFPGWRVPDDYVRKNLFRRVPEPNQKDWTNNPIPISVLRLMPSSKTLQKKSNDFFQLTPEEELISDAIHIFKNILGFCGDKIYPFPSKLAEDVINKGIEKEDLRDEIYCQLIKQLTHNPNSESASRCWQLLCICSHSFPPSIPTRVDAVDALYPYLFNTLNSWQSSENQFVAHIQYVIGNLHYWVTPRASIRDASGETSDLLPITANQQELVAEPWNSPPLSCPLHFCDGSSISVNIVPPETASMLTARIARVCGVSSTTRDRCALFEVTPNMKIIRKLLAPESIYELLVNWNSDSTKKKSGQLHKIVFQLEGFPEGKVIPLARGSILDQHLLHLIYTQVCKQVNLGVLREDEKFSLEMAALQVQIEFGECSPGVRQELMFLERWPQFIPVWLVKQYPSRSSYDWVEEITKKYYELTFSNENVHVDKAKYIENCHDLPAFNSVSFQAKLAKSEGDEPKEGSIAVKSRDVVVLDENNSLLFECPIIQFVENKRGFSFCVGGWIVSPSVDTVMLIMDRAFMSQQEAIQ
eukprot:c12213_g1_i2.p1 GENE.c12213_g1_i2~~c12213_g1_i2.p1  ORF type:complete len:2183 (+),score=510.34 c12213_g1_i2:803-6550(+)